MWCETDLLFLFECGACNVGVCQYARTHTINVILTSYKGNTGQVFAGIALVLGQYYIHMDQLSGQYRENLTGLGCRGLASCMTTVTCHAIIM